MSSPVSALEKHECPACGAQAEWNPGKQKLICPFCDNRYLPEESAKIDERHAE